MPKRYPMQLTFEGGELSPLLYSRPDLPGYQKSATRMINMMPDSRGPAISRKGAEYKDDVADPADRDGRLFTFRRSSSITYIVAVTGSQVWITDEGSLVSTDNLLTNGGFDTDGTGWTTETAVDGTVNFGSGEAIIRAKGGYIPGSYALIKQNITGAVAGNTHQLRVDVTTVFSNVGSDPELTVKVGESEGSSDLINFSVKTGGIYSLEFVPVGTSIWVELLVNQVNSDPGSQRPFAPVLTRTNSVAILDLTAGISPGNENFPSPWTESQIRDLQVEMAPDLQEMYFVHREVTPQKLSLDITVDPPLWSFGPVVFTHDVDGDPWVTEFPGAITFHQGRLVLASTITRPVTIWASKPGAENYDDFTLGAQDAPDDAIVATLARNADIQWVKGGKVLYVGCDNSEHIVSSDGPVLTPSDIETDQQSVYGSARAMGDWVSEDIAFISNDRRRLRLFEYSSDSQISESGDITWAAEHITEGLLREVHLAPNPTNVIWGVLETGIVTSCTYDKTYGALGWARHAFGGVVKSATVAEESGVSVLYLLVLRDGKLRLDRIGSKEVFMDEYAERSYAVATNTVDRLEHLEGQTVQILADGAYRPDEVVTGGEIVVTGDPATQFIVGIAMPRLLETMRVDSNMGQSTAGHTKRWNKILLRLYQSGVPFINGKREASRTPQDVMDVREAFPTQDIEVWNLGWGKEGTILIEQDLPFELRVVGIFGELNEESL